MARGHPDFFGSSTFPKFGDFRGETVSQSCAGLTTTTFLDLAYKGRAYGGYLKFTLDDDSDASAIITILDGESVSWVAVANLRNFNMIDVTQQLMKLTRFEYNGTNIDIILSLAQNITFDYQFKMQFNNLTATARSVVGNVIMAEVV